MRKLPLPIPLPGGKRDAWEYDLALAFADASPASFAHAEVEARLATWHPEQAIASDRLWLLTPDRLDAGTRVETWSGAADIPLAALQCGHDSLFVLGPNADFSDAAAAALAEPQNLMLLGRRLGIEAGELALAKRCAGRRSSSAALLPSC
ncbi:MAG TPA: hypothetical protein PKW82_02235, partial [Spirochaetales bacterium]|nr:hypothetical protein [Spirochaetales bacterium]